MAKVDPKVKKSSIARDRSHYLYEDWRSLLYNFFMMTFIAIGIWLVLSALEHIIDACTHRILDPSYQLPAPFSQFLSFPWLLVIIIMLGAFIRGWLIKMDSWRSCEGDGAENAIQYFHDTYDEQGPTSEALAKRYQASTFLYTIRKFIVTMLTLATGGSGGLEGPAIPLGESVGAGIAKKAKIAKPDDLRVFQMAGIAGGIATILNAPVTAAIFASEVVFSDHFIYRPLIYALYVSLLVFELNNYAFGGSELFSIAHHAQSYSMYEYLMVALVATCVSAPAGLGVNFIFERLKKLFHAIPLVFRAPAGAACAVSLALALWYGLGLAPFYILGVGEQVIRDVINGTGSPMLQVWWVLLVLVFAKTFATGFTLMSGGSAGKLVPAMFMGGLSGAAMYYALVAVGVEQLYAGHEIYVIAGIASSLVAVIEVPLAAIILVMEVFGASYAPPAIISVVICHKLVKRFKLYRQN